MSWEEAVDWLKAQPGERELVKACYFDDPLIEAAERFRKSAEWREVRRYLPRPPASVLDLGAGRGISSYALAKEGYETVALEPDASLKVGAGAIRRLAIEAGLGIKVMETWGESLPFEDEIFDCVYARQVLHHARDLKKLCSEAARVLKRGGIFIATREHVISRREDLEAFFKNHPLHRLFGGENAYLLKEYTEAILTAGIRLDRILNPYETEINLFPETIETLRAQFARELRLPWPGLIPDFVIKRVLGRLCGVPGRLYTFIGYREG